MTQRKAGKRWGKYEDLNVKKKEKDWVGGPKV